MMKTKNLVFIVALMLSGNVLFAQKFEVNPEASSIEWVAKKLAYQHHGTVQLKSGNLEMKDDQIDAGNFVVDMSSITVSDIDDQGRNQRLVGHLKSDEFFGVETYPEATFVVTQSSKFSNGKASVTGNLTIKGKTEPVTFEVQRSGQEFTAKMEFDRSKFDVRYGSDSFFDNLGDNAINNIVTLNIKLLVK